MQLAEAGSAPTAASSTFVSGKHPVAGTWSLSMLQQPTEGRSAAAIVMASDASSMLHSVLVLACKEQYFHVSLSCAPLIRMTEPGSDPANASNHISALKVTCLAACASWAPDLLQTLRMLLPRSIK